MEGRYVAERKVGKREFEGWKKSDKAPERGGLVFMVPPEPKPKVKKPKKIKKVDEKPPEMVE